MAVIKVKQKDGTYKSMNCFNGKSAYELAVKHGFIGSEQEWLESLKGGDTASIVTTDTYSGLNTTNKTIIGSINELDGEIKAIASSGGNGKSAYELAVQNGFQGTEQEWLASLKGEKGSDATAATTDDKVQVLDVNSHFTADDQGNKKLSNILDQLFQFADNGKKSIASTIGNPLSATDTFTQMDTKIGTIKTNLKNNLTDKNIELLGTETMSELVNKVGDIKASKLPSWASPWISAKDMIEYRNLFASSAVDYEIYCFGGFYYGKTFNNNYCYNTLTNIWVQKTNMTTTRSSLTSSTVNGKIYCIGGCSNTQLSTNECYDPSTDTWTTKTDMTTGRYGLTSSVVDNKIYCIGGTGSTHLDTNECYDPSTDAWTSKASMTTIRSYLASSVVDNKIYCIGGRNSSGSYFNTNECYDPSTDTWTTKASMTTGRHELTSSVVDNKIYCIGGAYYYQNYSNFNECYDPSTDTWKTKASMPTERTSLSSLSVDNKIFVIGGNNGDSGSSSYLSINECYIPDMDV